MKRIGFVIILAFVLASCGQPVNRTAYREANYASGGPRFKILLLYDDSAEPAHVQFDHQAIGFFRKLTVGEGFVVDSTQTLDGYTLDRTDHPVTKNLPASYVAPASEFYQWTPEPRENPDIEVLVSLSPKNFPMGLKDIVYGGDFPVVWTNRNYRMVYINMGHGDEQFTDATEKLLFINAFRWLVSRDPSGNPFDK